MSRKRYSIQITTQEEQHEETGYTDIDDEDQFWEDDLEGLIQTIVIPMMNQ